MYTLINNIVCIGLLVIFLVGVFSCLTANNKYNGILKTVDGKFMDKDVLMIEHTYRHLVVSGRKPLNTKIFVEKNLYGIKVNKVPIYILEDLAVNTLYCTILVGLTFTFLEIALMSKMEVKQLQSVLLCGIVGLILGVLLLGVRMVCRLEDKKEIATIYMCNHLDNELKIVMDGVKIANEGYGKNKKDKKIRKIRKGLFKGLKTSHEHGDSRVEYLRPSAKVSKKRANKSVMDEDFLDDVIKELMS
ncbi:hypothetical protein HZI73_02325 [Vallitalea pronyensis]|uniref:Uncharacterized protein n=1 Tax=Vallitalea pronyensis TaxID=1348613 RepID=A0A8J8MH73_9FIRM|nr:hypothetical protein [Vallitalea pronyensis]QUI21188.1 hypothetical protein HZI73_02325 [Vallitalea pronyensis]